MRSITLSFAAVALFAVGSVHPVQGQIRQQGNADALDGYVRAVADYFNVPAPEAVTLAEWGLPPENLPVALFLARRGGVSPDALLALRRGGRGWSELAGRYGLDASTFHTPLPPSAASGPLGRIHRAYQERPPSEWGGIAIQDDEIMDLVNVAFLTDFLDESPARVLEARQRTGSWVTAYVELIRTRG